MSDTRPITEPAARPTGSAAKTASADPAQIADLTDDGTARWGIVRYNEGERVGWVRTGLTFENAKNLALDFNSNASDLGIEYRVAREGDPEPEFEEITIAGPIIRATSGTVLIDTQTQQNVLPRREVTVRVPVVAATRDVAPRPTPLELEENAHAQFRETANVMIADLEARIAETRAALDKANAQITDQQAKPSAMIIPVEANDFTPDSKLTKEQTRARQLARALKHVAALLDAVEVPTSDDKGPMLLDARIRWLAEKAGLDTSQLPPSVREFNVLWNTRETPPDGPGKVLVGPVGQKAA
jgi:RNase P/RNase MRP subunit p29